MYIHYLPSGVDMSYRVTDGNSTHHLIVQQSVEVANGSRETRSHGCVRCYGHWLHTTILTYQERIGPTHTQCMYASHVKMYRYTTL